MKRKPVRLRPVEERDAIIQELIETVDYVNLDGSLYRPDELPVIDDPEGDEERLDELVDPPGRDATDLGLLDDRQQRLL